MDGVYVDERVNEGGIAVEWMNSLDEAVADEVQHLKYGRPCDYLFWYETSHDVFNLLLKHIGI